MLTIFEYSVVVESLLTPCHNVHKNSKWTFHTFHFTEKKHAYKSPMQSYDGTTQVKGRQKNVKIQKKNKKNCFCSYISSLNTPCALLPIIDHHPLPFSQTIL